MKRILPLILAFAMSLSARAQVQRMVCDYDLIARITGSSKNSLMVSYHQARKKIEKEINK